MRRMLVSVFERYAERARQVIVLGQEEARTLKHSHIGTEHILLGLRREQELLAAPLLSPAAAVAQARANVAQAAASHEPGASAHLPFTPRAKKVLDLALQEALSLGGTYIRTEHILLGLVGEHHDLPAQIPLDFGADSEQARNELTRMLSAFAARRDADPIGMQRREDESGATDLAAAEFPELGTLSDAALDNLIDELLERERSISYSRRLLRGKIDVLSAERQHRRNRE